MEHSASLTSQSTPEQLSFFLHGAFTLTSVAPLLTELPQNIEAPIPPKIVVDLAQVQSMDDAGTLVLLRLQRLAKSVGSTFALQNIPEHLRAFLDMLQFSTIQPKKMRRKRKKNFFVRFGEKTYQVLGQSRAHILFVGEVTTNLCALLRYPRRLRIGSTVEYMHSVGVDALPIVGLISFLMGLIMAFMSAVQLQQFGANIYVASLVALAMVRELGPIMTAIMVAGRSGSAFAAEIGTMKVSEEVDALITMGLRPTEFLVLPKIVSAVLVVPFLALFSNLFAIAGGLLIGVGVLDLTVHTYMTQTMSTLTIFDINWGIFKSAIFALLIAMVGCFKGYQVRGGAASVGQATTSSVVTSIFLIVLVDSLFAIILRYWRP